MQKNFLSPSATNLTQLLIDWGNGNQAAYELLVPLVYKELHRLAASYMRRQRSDHTLQPTALVHEVYLKLVDEKHIRWQNRAHFFGMAAQMMRNILVDYARQREALKRGGSAPKLSLSIADRFAEEPAMDVLALHHALERLETFDARQSRVVELRFFGGLSIEETAVVMKISTATVKREWKMAKAWLYQEISTS
jgi:RNA polymerase sigma-70 factor, ECF subfamily